MRARGYWVKTGQIHAHWGDRWISVAIVLSVVCVVATLFEPDLADKGVFRHLRTFSLGGENSFGAWWSGAMLLIGGFHALDGYFLHRDDKRVARGWLSLALILLVLAMDEVGSVHERLPAAIGMPGLAALSLGLGGFSILALWKSNRTAAMWIATAFGIFAFAAIQDDVLNHLQFWDHHRSLRSALEEATEVTAMLMLLHVAVSNTETLSRAKDLARESIFEAIPVFRMPILTIGLIAAPVFAYISSQTLDTGRGQIATWLACAGFLMAGMAVLRSATRSETTRTWAFHALCALCIVASICVAVIYPARYPAANHFVFSLIGMALCVFWISAASSRQREFFLMLSAICASLVLLS